MPPQPGFAEATSAPRPVAPTASRVLVFLATRNEAGNIASLLAAIGESVAQADLLVIDDASDDGTVETVGACASPRITLLERHHLRGIGSAHLLALLHAVHHGYDALVTMDADWSHDPAAIPALLDALGRGADLVIGSRYAAGGACDCTGWRGRVSRAGNRCARILLGLPLHEYTTSLRAFRVDALRRLDPRRLRVGGYAFFPAAVAEASRCGLRIVEVPIHFRVRRHGVSKRPAAEIVRATFHLARLTLRPRRTPLHAQVPARCPACATAYSFVVASAGAGACLYCGWRRR